MIGGISGFQSGYGSYFYNSSGVNTVSATGDKHGTDAQLRAMKRAGKVECETCSNRRYQDGSDEMVSFKAPGHISPESSAAVVIANEQEHVANAYSKAANKDGKVLQASVALKTATCPECGRSYVAGGTTTTQIKYNEENPYGKNQKVADQAYLIGMNFDVAV